MATRGAFFALSRTSARAALGEKNDHEEAQDRVEDGEQSRNHVHSERWDEEDNERRWEDRQERRFRTETGVIRRLQ